MSAKVLVVGISAFVVLAGTGGVIGHSILTADQGSGEVLGVESTSSYRPYSSSSPKQPSTQASVLQSQQAPQSSTGDGVSQPRTTQSTSPVAPRPNPTGPAPISDADKAAMAQAQQQIAEQQERARQTRCANLGSAYNTSVAAAEANHQKRLEDIQLDHRRRGTASWGIYQADVNAENARHQAAITAIENKLKTDLVSNGCV